MLTISENDDPVEHYLKHLRNQVLDAKGGQVKASPQASTRSIATEINRLSAEVATDRPDLVATFLGEGVEGAQPSLASPREIDEGESARSTSTGIKTVMSSKIPDLKRLMKDF